MRWRAPRWILAVAWLFFSLRESSAQTHDVLTVGVTPGAELYSVTGISVDSKGCLYLTDMLDYSVKVFDARGAFLRKVGRRGSGPGEFRAPTTTFVRGETLAVMQINDRRIQFFVRGLTYAGAVPLEGDLPIHMAAGPKGELYVAALGDPERQVLSVYPGMTRRGPRRIPLEPSGEENHLYTACKIAVAHDGTIIVAYTFLNRVDLHDAGGKLRKRLSISAMRSLHVEKSGSGWPEESYFKDLTTDQSGTIMVLGGSLAPHDSRDVFVYNAGGAYAGSFTLPDRSRLIASDGRGYIYVTGEDGTVVRKYQLSSFTIR